MNKIEMKRELRNVKRDLEYYTKEYDMSQKEAYALLHKAYYLRMMLTKDYVELGEREQIYKDFKNNEGETK